MRVVNCGPVLKGCVSSQAPLRGVRLAGLLAGGIVSLNFLSAVSRLCVFFMGVVLARCRLSVCFCCTLLFWFFFWFGCFWMSTLVCVFFESVCQFGVAGLFFGWEVAVGWFIAKIKAPGN